MQRIDTIILGGGLVGLTTALALDAHGISTLIVDPAPPVTTLSDTFDGRASAIASASWRMLEAIGVATELTPHGCPIRSIEVRDGLQRAPLRFDAGAEGTDESDALGTMVENRRLRRVLHTAAQAAKNVTMKVPGRAVAIDRSATGAVATLDDGSAWRADVVIAAEGRNSPTRTAAGIRVAKWQYDHAAIISAFDHDRPHHGVAHEIFYPDGPFALLPMLSGPDVAGRSALVWTVKAADAAGMLALSDRAFAHEAAKRAGGLLGTLSAVAPRSTYPLGFHHAARIIGERLVLVGDAAHGIHPIAGQGLNLGFRDVAALVEVLIDGARTGLDLGDAVLLERYQRWRSLDTLAVATATDTLTRLFGIPGTTARGIRRFGMGAVNAIAPLKGFFMAEARGETGKLPRLLQGMLV